MGGTVITGIGGIWIPQDGSFGDLLDGVYATLAITGQPASINLSTEGTIDWCVLGGGSPFNPRTQAIGSLQAKRTSDGKLAYGFDWKSNGWSALTQAGGCTFTSTASDGLQAAAVNQNTRAGYFTGTSSSTGSGWTCRVPCFPGPSDLSGVRRRLRIYAASFNTQMTVTVRASDGSLTPITDTYGASGGGTIARIIEIIYVGPRGVDLIVDSVATASSTNPNQTLGAATIEGLA